MKVIAVALIPLVAGCSSIPPAPSKLPPTENSDQAADYVIGAGDSLHVFVLRNSELSTSVTVRPDGKISIPLIEDLPAAGSTPTQLSREIEKTLSQYVQNPVVTIMVTGFVGPLSHQVRVVGEATKPQALPYRVDMTVLDVMIAVGGLTDFAAANRAVIVRQVNGTEQTFSVRLDDLLKDGDVSANVPMAPGDILMIPQSWF